MKKIKTANIVKGVGIGMAIGGAMGLAGGAMSHPGYSRSLKKGLGKAMKTVESVLDVLS